MKRRERPLTGHTHKKMTHSVYFHSECTLSHLSTGPEVKVHVLFIPVSSLPALYHLPSVKFA